MSHSQVPIIGDGRAVSAMTRGLGHSLNVDIAVDDRSVIARNAPGYVSNEGDRVTLAVHDSRYRVELADQLAVALGQLVALLDAADVEATPEGEATLANTARNLLVAANACRELIPESDPEPAGPLGRRIAAQQDGAEVAS